jgi:hypothetical protein
MTIGSRVSILFFTFLLSANSMIACQPKTQVGPNLNNLVATGMLGTRQAWAIGTIVSATNNALPVREITPAPTTAIIPSPSPLPTAADPCASRGEGKLSYADSGIGYCLLYPDDFFVNKPASGGVEFLGPVVNKNTDPGRAYISIKYKEPVNGHTLDELALKIWKDAQPGYRIKNIQLGGREALVADDLMIDNNRWAIRQVLFTYRDSVYLITLSPMDKKTPDAQEVRDVTRFWETAKGSFVFR